MKKVVVLPGDDAAAEAVFACMPLLQSLDLPIEWQMIPAGVSLQPSQADAADTVLFGSSNGTTKGLGYLRMGWGTYANVRPVKWRRGVPTAMQRPEGIDYVIVRECLEDVYAGIEGELSALSASTLDLRSMADRGGISLRYPLTGVEGRFGVKIFTRAGIERVACYAAELARTRRQQGHSGKVTIAGKWNVNPQTDGYFRQVAEAVIRSFDDVQCNAYLADDMARRLVVSPHEFDVVLLPNLYGDLLSDLGAATVGGLGLAPSGSYGEGRAYFEPIHGSAPDIAGRHIINPAATLLSAAMMFDYLGFVDAAQKLEAAVDATLAAARVQTADLGGRATTEEFVQAVSENVVG